MPGSGDVFAHRSPPSTERSTEATSTIRHRINGFEGETDSLTITLLVKAARALFVRVSATASAEAVLAGDGAERAVAGAEGAGTGAAAGDASAAAPAAAPGD